MRFLSDFATTRPNSCATFFSRHALCVRANKGRHAVFADRYLRRFSFRIHQRTGFKFGGFENQRLDAGLARAVERESVLLI